MGQANGGSCAASSHRYRETPWLRWQFSHSIQAWAMLIWPLLVANDQSLFNMELGLTTFQFAFSNDTGKLMAGSVVSVVPMLIVFLLMRRRIIENMALTGLKG